MSEEQQQKPKMCGGCEFHQGTACDVHAGVILATAAACDDFQPKKSGEPASVISGPVRMDITPGQNNE